VGGKRTFVPRTPLDWPILLLLFMVLGDAWVSLGLSYSLGSITVLLFSIGLMPTLVE